MDVESSREDPKTVAAAKRKLLVISDAEPHNASRYFPQATISRYGEVMQSRIKKKIEEARIRALANPRIYTITETGKGRIKCHADNPDPECSRCKHRIAVRRLRERRAQQQLTGQ